MSFVNHNYGCNKREIKKLMNDRLAVKQRLRYYTLKLESLDSEISGLLDLAEGKVGVKK